MAIAPNEKSTGAFSLLNKCHDMGYNIHMLICIECKHFLMELPIYNNAQDSDYPPSILWCNNADCSRFGLLTVTFKHDKAPEEKPEEGDKKDSNPGVQPETVSSA